MKHSLSKSLRSNLFKTYKLTDSILDRPLAYKHPPSVITGPILFAGPSITQKSFYANTIAQQLNFKHLNASPALNQSHINANSILDICPSQLPNDMINSIPMVINLDANNMYPNLSNEDITKCEEYEIKIAPLIEHFHKRDVLISFDALSPKHILTDAMIDAIYGNKIYLSDYSAFHKLDCILSNHMHMPSNEYKSLASEFINAVLIENLSKRTGLKRRGIFLATNNNIKLDEIIRVMDRYGIEVLKTPKSVFEHPEFINYLLQYKDNEFNSVALLHEQSRLVKPGTDIESTQRNGVHADHISTLNCILKDNNMQFKHTTHGMISSDTNKNYYGMEQEIFGWDDIFKVLNSGKTYQEHKIYGLKISSRDMVLSEFLREKIYYKEPKSLKCTYNNIKTTRAIDFELDIADIINHNPLYNTFEVKALKLRNMLNYVVNDGIFIKCSQTRMEQNYWQPGLNAGLPLIAKKDALHESTFMFHDFGHFAIKDLIFNGENSSLHRKTYICHRMMSEAITLVLADVLFVHALKISGIEYDWTKRKIYPLFSQLFDLDSIINKTNMNLDLNKLKQMMYANVKFVLEGNDSLLLDTNLNLETELRNYKEKYIPFFVSDFKWTEHNFDNMCNQTQTIQRWWSHTQPLRHATRNDVSFETIGDFINLMQQKYDINDDSKLSFVDKIFEIVFEHNIIPMFNKCYSIDERHIRLHKAFTRYFMGQMSLYSKYASIPEMIENESKIISMFLSQVNISNEASKLNAISWIRQEFESDINKLKNSNIISTDDAFNFKDIYPLFDPFYVTYDEAFDKYPDLKKTANTIINNNAHLEYHKQHVEKILSHKMNKNENKYYKLMFNLIENTGGQIDKGLFVIKPGIDIICVSKFNNTFPINEITSKHIFITFAINGISIETLLEFIAHSEASVARLTSSKTNAMIIPFYKIQSCDHSNAIIHYLKSQISQRKTFEYLYNPRQKWGENANEIFNQLTSATKCSAFTYTMTLADLRKMLIGRLSNEGNETEVKEVARIMCKKLYSMFGNDIIPNIEQFEQMGNNEKYISNMNNMNEIEIIMNNYLQNLFVDDKNKIKCIGNSDLSTSGYQLFDSVNINNDCESMEQIAEYCSRITYLSFKTKKSNINDTKKYLQNIIQNKGHKSVLSAYGVCFAINGKYLSDIFKIKLIQLILECGGNTYYNCNKENGNIDNILMSFNLKQLNQLFISLPKYVDEKTEPIVKELIEIYHKRYPIAINCVTQYFS